MAIEEETGGPPATGVESAEEHLENLTFAAFGEGFEPAYDVKTTATRVAEATTVRRPDNPPQNILSYECRIGASKFFIPPININVNQRYKAGSMTGSAIRQQNSPKFSTGHTETTVEMTLYFPTVEEIWGVQERGPMNMLEIDFDNPDTPDSTIDKFLSSLRGLVAEFKYAPILPIRNQYLNQVFNITGVALRSMTVSTVPAFPHCMAVNITLLKFNHKVYLPMIEDFNQAVHWGYFRQYMGRAAAKLNEQAKPFKVFDARTDQLGEAPDESQMERPLKQAHEILVEERGLDYTDAQRFFRPTSMNASRLEFYYPFHTPAEVIVPDLADLRPDDNPLTKKRARTWWEKALSVAGLQVDTYDRAHFERVQEINESNDESYFSELSEYRVLVEYLRTMSLTLEDMGPEALEEYVQHKLDEHPGELSDDIRSEIRREVEEAWFAAMFSFIAESPAIAAQLSSDDRRRRQLTIDEWDIPMWPLDLNYDYVTVEGISLTLGNTFSRLQLQMQDEPTHQHIGGEDTRLDISMTFHGEGAETELLKMRNMFDSINGLARLEHNHGVLGFIGIKNLLTQLVGMTYAIPLNFSVDTVPGYPHVYNVTLSLVDFDVFQQKREQLGATQQAELVHEFGKRNPMFRIRQLWGAFNAYPDFPLSVRDDEGDVVGHLDPDFYFRAFKPIDDDISDPKFKVKKEAGGEGAIAELKAIQEAGAVSVNFGEVEGDVQELLITDEGIAARDGEEFVEYMSVNSGDADLPVHTEVPGLTPLAQYDERYLGGSADPTAQFSMMAKDMQYRDKSARMVRAFPTYMLWLIDEGGNFAGMKLFDNFYGLQSVLDMSIVRSEEVMADTLVLRLSNLYAKLSTEFSAYLDESTPAEVMYNQVQSGNIRMASGVGQHLVKLESIKVKPGVRVHLRMGYSSDPNALETVFNGAITDVETGDIMTVVAQSDAVELGAIVNSSNEKGHSGKMDGSMAGLYLSEPRDLMLTLLTQASSTAREVMAHATLGQIYSENRFGVKHFGSMLYTPMSEAERDKEGRVKNTLRTRVAENGIEGTLGGAATSFVDVAMITIMHDGWVNLSSKRDYEIFKRNIYPGNGVGIAQFLGGDFGDIAFTQAIDGSSAITATQGLTADGTVSRFDPTTGERYDQDVAAATRAASAAAGEDALRDEEGNVAPPPDPAFNFFTNTFTEILGTGDSAQSRVRRSLADSFGIINSYDDDAPGNFNEVAFRAQTYMKTIWDLFKVCAALLPDYIVAVRPFEDRSTVFYGKPHWLYTSGLIPLSRGVFPKDGPDHLLPDSEMQDIFERMQKQQRDKQTNFGADLISAIKYAMPGADAAADPTETTEGMRWAGTPESVLSAPSAHPEMSLPFESGPVGIEMHLPTSDNLRTDIAQHKQIAELPPNFRHPFYMDRADPGNKIRGGHGNDINRYDPQGPEIQAVLSKDGVTEDASLPGKGGAFGVLSPEDEQWYMCQYWPLSETHNKSSQWKGKRILVYCERTQKGVVCTPGDAGPSYEKATEARGVVAGISPDGYIMLGSPGDADVCYYKIMPDDTPLGPMSFGDKAYNPGTTDFLNVTRNQPPTDPESDAEPESTSDEIPSWAKGEADYDAYAFENGYKAGSGIPVNYTETSEDGTYLYYDKLGEIATSAYIHARSGPEADDIWAEFRTRYIREDMAKDIFIASPAFDDETDEDKAELRSHLDDDTTDIYKEYENFVVDFQKYLWQKPWARGWVVKVANREGDLGSLWDDPGAIVPDYLGMRDAVDTVLPNGIDVSFWNNNDNWQQSTFNGAFEAYLRGGERELEDYITDNQQDGLDTRNPITQAVERGVRSTTDVVQGILSSLGSVATGLLDAIRFQIFQLTAGIGLADRMQQKTNLLNHVYNDSIYYSAGLSSDGSVDNPLLYYADNPFTREYGEPVAEIREPFQRMHMISSFRHIISNGIQETTDNVATVITALSNGADAVTVHFDKGMSPDRQVEKTIETGLFYDDPGFWTFLNPIETMREMQLKVRGNSPELSAKRVALAHLKENLKNIYQGELVVLGDPGMRPYDVVYMADVYERMYGFFEVDQVVHHFSPSTGFVTSITPNACVSVNDPGQFYMWANWQGRFAMAHIRDEMREHLGVTADNNGDYSESAINPREEFTANDLAKDIEDSIMGSGQYYGGSSAIIKSLTSLQPLHSSESFVGRTTEGLLNAGALVMGLIGSKLWRSIRDNLLDQHGCYINYLTKNGSPMDASLSYTQGVAVGHQKSVGIVFQGLKFGDISLQEDGERKIRTQDVIKTLQWDEYGPNDRARQVDMFVDATMSEVRQLAGRDGELIANNHGVEVYWVHIYNVVDADTFDFNVLGGLQHGQYTEMSGMVFGNRNRLRLTGADAIEDPFKQITDPETREAVRHYPGVRATDFARATMTNRKVALRVNVSRKFDDMKEPRVLGYVFHNAPDSVGAGLGPEEAEEEIRDYLMAAAGNSPLQPWDSFTDDGKPVTFDWELIMRGHADTIVSPLNHSYADGTVHGSDWNTDDRGSIGGKTE